MTNRLGYFFLLPVLFTAFSWVNRYSIEDLRSAESFHKHRRTCSEWSGFDKCWKFLINHATFWNGWAVLVHNARHFCISKKHAGFLLKLQLIVSVLFDDVPVVDLQSVWSSCYYVFNFPRWWFTQPDKAQGTFRSRSQTHILQYAAHMLGTLTHSYRCFLLH